jgi:hypothetical protein
MSKPAFITFTGVDKHTNPAELVQLADDYPVEFGLLFSPKRQGVELRYPPLEELHWFAEELPVRWAAHLCGGDAREVIERGMSRHDPLLRRTFQRVQINTADTDVKPSQIGNWAASLNLRAILQCRGPFPQVASVDVLYDCSGGRGIVPSEWPETVFTTFCGYAGGLRPDNVAEAVEQMGLMAAGAYWIDMESGVRSDDDRFSVAKCRAVCEAVYGAPRGRA